MLRPLSLGLLASAISVAALPAIAQEDGGADDLGVMSISLKDVVKPTLGFQGALQGAGTPNQAGIGGFLPLSVGENSVWFLDVLANVNFADRDNYSSIVNTTVAGATVSTSTRLGYRWLNDERSWMHGINAGYDSFPMNTGGTDTGIVVSGTERSVFFQQVAVSAEAVSSQWRYSGYGLIPVGEEDHQLNWFYKAGALQTYGLDVGYSITADLLAQAGGYYQNGDVDDDGNPEVDGFGFKGRLSYEINNSLIIGVNFSYDEAFEARYSGDLKLRFGAPALLSSGQKIKLSNVIKALSTSPDNRNVRIHDDIVNNSYCRNYLNEEGLLRACHDKDTNKYIAGNFCPLDPKIGGGFRKRMNDYYSRGRREDEYCIKYLKEVGIHVGHSRDLDKSEVLKGVPKDKTQIGLSKYGLEI